MTLTQSHPDRTQTAMKVLVVDDDEAIVDLLLTVLNTDGYVAEAAPGARSAIRILDLFEPDVVLTDLVMPEGEGMELILHLARRERRPAVVAMSGDPTGVLFLRASELLGVRAALRKPFPPDRLLRTLETIQRSGEA